MLEEQVGEDAQVKSELDGEGVHCADAAGTLCTVQQVEEVVQMQVEVVKEAELQPAVLLPEEEQGNMQVGQDTQAAQNLQRLQLAVVGILLLRGEEKGWRRTLAASWQLWQDRSFFLLSSWWHFDQIEKGFVFCQVLIVPPVNPVSCSPDNNLRQEEAKEDGEKTGNRKTGKVGGQFAEGESPKKDKVEERDCNPKTESVGILLNRQVQ